MNVQTYTPVQGMIICAEGGEYIKRSDHDRALKDTGFIDKNGVYIYEGDKVNFTVRGHTHGPEPEYETNGEVWWCQEDGCWAFGRYVISDYPAPRGRLEGTMIKGHTWHYVMTDGIMPETLEVVP